MSVEVSYNKQFLLGLIFIIIILIVIEIGIKTYEFIFPSCEFIDADVFAEVDFGIKRSICLDSIYLSTTSTPITLYPPNQNFETITINSHGFRGQDFSSIKNDDVFRIFIVGGSTTFGFGSASDNTTIPGFLQNQFDKSGHNVEVINAGIGAAWSFSEEYLIENYLLDYKPDLIIIYDGANDSRYRILEDEQKNSVGIGEFIPNFYRTPYFLNDFIFKVGFAEEKLNPKLNTERVNSVSSLWNQRMQNICNIGNENDFDVAIILQPMLTTENRELYGDETIFHKKHVDLHGENAIMVYEIMKESIETLENCSLTHDMTQIFQDSDKAVYWDDVHIIEEGNKVVADELSIILESLID